MEGIKLYYFKESEFRGQIELCSPRLLLLLDTFRFIWGHPVLISPHPRAIGRTDGDSQHNYKKHGEVRAIDIMPEWPHDGIFEPSIAVDLAESIGFTGIGYYPDWQLDGETRPGLHVDVREDREPGDPALWSGVKEGGKQIYKSIDAGLELIRENND